MFSANLLAANKQPRQILLRSSWQTVNIGDVGHTPGALKLLETYLPDAQITLWPSKVDRGVDAMLKRAFPKLRIVEGKVNADGKPVEKELQHVFAEADFMLHGSGPSVVAQNHLEAWRKTTGKPYGIYGVTVEKMDDALRDLMNKARFVFFRDTTSLKFCQANAVKAPVMEFTPDATFALHLHDDVKAVAYLKANGLEDRKFICAIPRMRYTPYHKIHNTTPNCLAVRLSRTTPSLPALPERHTPGIWPAKSSLPRTCPFPRTCARRSVGRP